jgi:tetratricopeptide (TPR) repeat protein
VSKTCSRISRYGFIISVGLGISACAIVPQTPSSPSPPSSFSAEPAAQKNGQTSSLPDDSPRAVASLRLTEQARVLLESGQVDDAITTLERALNVNPSNGQNYYYLAEAWLKKGNLSQAREFNRLAAMYLRDDPGWMNRVKDQEERIKSR